jgi:ATP-dependent Clp protease adaptor protein ClpS
MLFHTNLGQEPNMTTSTELDTPVKTQIHEPGMWNVVLYNDDSTSMEFVVLVLMQIFHKSYEAAAALMIEIHEQGHGVAGTYPYELAHAKQEDVIYSARGHGYPLRCEIEQA